MKRKVRYTLFFVLFAVVAQAGSQQWYEYYYRKANTYLLGGNPAAALFYSDSAIAFNANADTIYTLRAYAYINLGHYPHGRKSDKFLPVRL